MSLSDRAGLGGWAAVDVEWGRERHPPRSPYNVSFRLKGICESPAPFQSETSKNDKNGVPYPHVVGKGGTPDSVSVPELQSIRREPWNNFCRQYGNRSSPPIASVYDLDKPQTAIQGPSATIDSHQVGIMRCVLDPDSWAGGWVLGVGFCPWRRNGHTGRRTGLGS
ncbi:hypothetical protein ASPNIDRAFT_41920 [Aspergillus niger ATCC 1015]|uniref:Uncharacterized protein n=1 Tax=Aspergillus niger (strain ATCC 1015 / CBS 113.46 / FGSC A1144 / LSHB Ac4 / NCTC 3858a / NRRL 328 / USDA 3528.7) TaxID=380704 RepID=G3XNS7_ASPNA|nr:hypothetical protein ASPNIDRAFT_41920 [Aspergillus niger ATCC 1015]